MALIFKKIIDNVYLNEKCSDCGKSQLREYLIKNQELVNKKLIEKKELLEHNKIVIEEADLKQSEKLISS